MIPGGLAIAEEGDIAAGECDETAATDAEAEADTPEPIDDEALALLYEENCAFCHGYDGFPILPGAPNFAAGERLEKCDAALLVTMMTGKNDMPPWEDVLSRHEQRELLNFVRRFAAGEE
jgi:mono/diheme cytochrome c family protein